MELRLGTKSWAMLVGEVHSFGAGSEPVYGSRFAISCSPLRGPGVGDRTRTLTDTVVGSIYTFYSARARFYSVRHHEHPLEWSLKLTAGDGPARWGR